MASEIKVPTLGESVTEAIVARWLKQPGEAVAVDEALVELETDKVTLEVNAPEAGVLAEVVAREGETVAVGALLGRIGAGNGQAAAQPAPRPAAKTAAKTARVEPATLDPAAAPAPAAPQRAKAGAPAPKAPAAEEEPRAAAPKRAGAAEGESLSIEVPTLGESVTEAIVSRWLKEEGQAVAADEPIAELETDKVTLEVNAPKAGVLTSRKVEAGATVGVGAVIATISVGAAAETAPEAAQPAAKPAPAKPPVAPKLEPAPLEEGEPAAPAAKAVTLDPARVLRTAPGGKIGTADLVSFLSGQELSPAVRRLVGEHGLDPGRIPASGKDGRLTKEDVEAAVRDPTRLRPAPMARQDRVGPGGTGISLPGGAPAPAAAPVPAPVPASAPGGAQAGERRERMTKLRQTIARRLKEAQATAAMLTTFNEVDMSQVMALRSRHKAAFEKAHGVKLGFLSFFAKAVVAAAKAVPSVNARIDGEEIVYWQRYDLGMAVSTPAGLMVPVIRDCEAKSMAEIEKDLIDLAARARDGKLKLDELQGGTFTITNGGVFGSLLSTPILNPPQSGILGLHKIEERPIAKDGQVVIRPMMYLALSYDHRLVDGREAVTFLVKVKEAIEEPERLLLGV